jgi:hypothetical protein
VVVDNELLDIADQGNLFNNKVDLQEDYKMDVEGFAVGLSSWYSRTP